MSSSAKTQEGTIYRVTGDTVRPFILATGVTLSELLESFPVLSKTQDSVKSFGRLLDRIAVKNGDKYYPKSMKAAKSAGGACGSSAPKSLFNIAGTPVAMSPPSPASQASTSKKREASVTTSRESTPNKRPRSDELSNRKAELLKQLDEKTKRKEAMKKALEEKQRLREEEEERAKDDAEMREIEMLEQMNAQEDDELEELERAEAEEAALVQ